MNNLNIAAILAVTCVVSSIGALAQNISSSEYKPARKNIVAGHKPAEADCGSFAGSARNICLVEARGRGHPQNTEPKVPGKPPQAGSVAKAESDYAVAKARCDNMTDTVRDVCAKEAKAALVRAKSDVRALRKSSRDNSTAVDESFEELMEMNYGN